MIQFRGVTKSFGDTEILKGIDLEIPTGKITVILGPSGTGKTVLLKHIIGLIRSDRGQVLVDGTDVGRLSDPAMHGFRKKFGMLFQGGALFDSLTVEENVAFPLREHTSLSAAQISQRVREKLALVGLTDAIHKMPFDLSGGMRKRVGLARAIALEPQIILYDEPTTGLDPLMTDQINRLILEMQQRLKMTSVIISHDIESTFEVADEVAMLHDGLVIERGAPSVFKKSSVPFVRQFLERKGR